MDFLFQACELLAGASHTCISAPVVGRLHAVKRLEYDYMQCHPTCRADMHVCGTIASILSRGIGLLALGIHGFLSILEDEGYFVVFIMTLKWSGEGVKTLFHSSEGVLIVIGPCLKDYLEVLVDETM